MECRVMSENSMNLKSYLLAEIFCWKHIRTFLSVFVMVWDGTSAILSICKNFASLIMNFSPVLIMQYCLLVYGHMSNFAVDLSVAEVCVRCVLKFY